MKIVYCIVLSSMIMVSCHDSIDQDQCPLEVYQGNMVILINGDSINFCPYAKETSLQGIIGDYYHEESQLLIRTFTILLPNTVGNFKVSDKQEDVDSLAVIFWTEVDVDIPHAFYDPIPNRPGEFVHVTHYDSISGRITGTFAFTLFLGPNDGAEPYPDSLVITDGYFDTYFVE